MEAINKIMTTKEALTSYTKQFNQEFNDCNNGIYFIEGTSKIISILFNQHKLLFKEVLNLKEKFIQRHFNEIDTNLNKSYPWLERASSIQTLNVDS
jgi:hypothetical protein